MGTLTTEELEAMPKGAMIKYQCKMDGAVWYEPVKQVLEGCEGWHSGADEYHYCPFCDEPELPIGYLDSLEVPFRIQKGV